MGRRISMIICFVGSLVWMGYGFFDIVSKNGLLLGVGQVALGSLGMFVVFRFLLPSEEETIQARRRKEARRGLPFKIFD